MVEALEAVLELYGVYLWGGLFALVFLLILWVGTIHLRVARTMRYFEQLVDDVDGANLVDVLERQVDVLNEVMERQDGLHHAQQVLEQSFQIAVQHVGVVRFNPFGDTGGDQSFSVALLDGAGNGVVLSSLFSRTGTRVFAKPIQRRRSSYTLTREEQEAINLANSRPAAATQSELPSR